MAQRQDGVISLTRLVLIHGEAVVHQIIKPSTSNTPNTGATTTSHVPTCPQQLLGKSSAFDQMNHHRKRRKKRRNQSTPSPLALDTTTHQHRPMSSPSPRRRLARNPTIPPTIVTPPPTAHDNITSCRTPRRRSGASCRTPWRSLPFSTAWPTNHRPCPSGTWFSASTCSSPPWELAQCAVGGIDGGGGRGVRVCVWRVDFIRQLVVQEKTTKTTTKNCILLHCSLSLSLWHAKTLCVNEKPQRTGRNQHLLSHSQNRGLRSTQAARSGPPSKLSYPTQRPRGYQRQQTSFVNPVARRKREAYSVKALAPSLQAPPRDLTKKCAPAIKNKKKTFRNNDSDCGEK